MSIKDYRLSTVYRGRLITITNARDENCAIRITAYLADEFVERKPPVSGKRPGHARRSG